MNHLHKLLMVLVATLLALGAASCDDESVDTSNPTKHQGEVFKGEYVDGTRKILISSPGGVEPFGAPKSISVSIELSTVSTLINLNNGTLEVHALAVVDGENKKLVIAKQKTNAGLEFRGYRMGVFNQSEFHGELVVSNTDVVARQILRFMITLPINAPLFDATEQSRLREMNLSEVVLEVTATKK